MFAHLRTLPTRAYVAYDGLLQRHTLMATTVSGALLAVAGDGITQFATATSDGSGSSSSVSSAYQEYDARRGAAFALFGAALTGPVNYVWLRRLNAIVDRLAPQGGSPAVASKVVLQSIFFQPLIYVPLFYTFTAVIRGWKWEYAAERVRTDYITTMKSIWAFWTPVCTFTFSVLPLRQQAVFMSAVSLCWNAILSFITNAAHREVHDQHKLERCTELGAPPPSNSAAKSM